MAAIDKIYFNEIEVASEFLDFLGKYRDQIIVEVGEDPFKYILGRSELKNVTPYPFDTVPHFESDTVLVTRFPMKIDWWLDKNCAITLVKSRLAEQYPHGFCEGCREEVVCKGEVQAYQVTGYAWKEVILYCVNHAQYDRKNGFSVVQTNKT